MKPSTKPSRSPVAPRKPADPAPDAPRAPVALQGERVAGRSVTFPATIPPMETAVKIHGEGGARIQLDVAELDLGAFLPALALRMKRLKVTFAEDDA